MHVLRGGMADGPVSCGAEEVAEEAAQDEEEDEEDDMAEEQAYSLEAAMGARVSSFLLIKV